MQWSKSSAGLGWHQFEMVGVWLECYRFYIFIEIIDLIVEGRACRMGDGNTSSV